MKYLLVLIVVVLGAWLLFGRERRLPKPPASTGKTPKDGATQMVECAHCGPHLPKSEALVDAAERPYCGEPHRLAGPR